MDKKHLEELVSMPIGLELVDVIDGNKLYSSEKLKQAFINALSSTGRVSKYFEQIKTLTLKNKVIIPCYMSKNILKLVKHKFSNDIEKKSMAAFYHQGKIYVMLDNISSVGIANNDLIASTVIHECVHLYAYKMGKKFVTLFKRELERYYISYFSRLFSLNKKPDIMPVIFHLDNIWRDVLQKNNFGIVNKELMKYYKLLEKQTKQYTTLDENKYKETLNIFIIGCKFELTNFRSFIMLYRQYKFIFEPLHKAYQDAFGKRNTYTFLYQEIIDITEVISVLSEMDSSHPKIVKMFRDMA